jgi:hypothetical protein
MNLSETEVERFYRLYHALLFYINERYSVLEGIERPGDLHKMNLDDIQKLKDIGGKTQKEVERIMKSLLPPEKIKLVYIFQLKTK